MDASRYSGGVSRRGRRRSVCAATLLWALTAGAGPFAVNYSPTGIAFDAVSNVVCVASASGINVYDTNGTFLSGFSGSSVFDLGAGTGGNVWVGNSSGGQKFTFTGSGLDGISLPSGTVGLGRELAIGGTNWVLTAESGGNVVARNLSSGAGTALFATPAGVTGADWTLRPGGYALEHVVVGVTTLDEVQTFTKEGTNGFQQVQSVTVAQDDYGNVRDMSFGPGVIWVAHDQFVSGFAVPYAYTVPVVPEASVSVGWTNGLVWVSWAGRRLEGSGDGQSWAVVSNAPQPLVVWPTNAQQFFRAVK